MTTERTIVAIGLALFAVGLSFAFTNSLALTMWGFLSVFVASLALSILDVLLWNKQDAGDGVLKARVLFLGSLIACCVYRLVAG